MRRHVFRSIRIVGVEDGSFQKGATQRTALTAVLLKGLKIADAKKHENNGGRFGCYGKAYRNLA